jgi:hypothetical protein
VKRDCKSEIDRPDRCYRCGAQGHRSRDCLARAPRCAICEDAGLPAAHLMGSQACNPPTAARRRRGTQPEETGVRSRTRDGSVSRADQEGAARRRRTSSAWHPRSRQQRTLRTFAASARWAERRSAATVRRGGASEAPLRGSYMSERADGQASHPTGGQKAAQDGCH